MSQVDCVSTYPEESERAHPVVEKDDFELLSQGCEDARRRIIEVFYEELGLIAHSLLIGQRRTPTLQTRDLQHLALIKIMDARKLTLANRRQLLALAATVMRNVLVDLARAKSATKRDGLKISIRDDDVLADPASFEVLQLHQALVRLKVARAEQHAIAELKIFGGWSNADVAAQLGLSNQRVKLLWLGAQRWLRAAMQDAF